MIHFKKIILILFFLSACSSIPKNTQNSCAIFEERYLWYKHTKASYERWGAPIHLQLAFVKKESDFNWLAKPPRKKLFKVIPFKRPSSSFGYSQAVKGTWEQYKRETNSPLATRARFKDSVDFIGWYIHKTNKILKISKKDPYKQYLAYYKGWGDYKNYSKDNLVIVSPDVGGVVRSRALAKYLDGLDLAIIDKRRDKANESEVMNIIGDVAGKECIVPDDIIDTAGTLCNAAKALKDAGASKVSAYITHPVLSGPAIERISNSEIDELVVTNSIPLTQDGQKCSKIRVISIAPIISECIKRLSNEESLSAVFL